MDDRAPQHFSDEQARAILARAIEIDSRAPMTTLDDLRVIAAEIGVSPASLQAALREQTAAGEARRVVATRRAAFVVGVLGALLGLAVGWLLGATTGSRTGLAGLGLWGVWLAATGGIVALHGATATLRSFHVRNAVLWAGIAAGGLASTVLADGGVERLPALLVVAWCVRGWITSSILGSAAVVAVRRARRPDGPGHDPDVTATARPAAGGRWARAARRAIAWIARPLRQGAAHVPPARGRAAAA